MTSIRFLYIPCPAADVAKALAKSALHARLAACANILPHMNSLYWWDGEIQDDAEALLILKTDVSHVEALITKLEVEHPYEVPCLAVLSLGDLNPAYASWLTGELG